jgi:murein DD-endopeptidase MepM/ murein hydrolase activator NlpD
MTIPQIDPTLTGATSGTDRTDTPNEAALRQAARQFEAVLLSQLTSRMNPTEDDENALFTNSGGMGMAQQMFGEQIAKTMSEAGGIGLAKMITDQMTRLSAGRSHAHSTNRARSAARVIRSDASSTEATPAVDGETPSPNVSSPARPAASSDSTALQLNPANFTGAVGAVRRRRVTPIEPGPAPIDPSTAANAPVSMSMAAAASSRHVTLKAPISGKIRSGFGMRRDPINGRMRFHEGVDIVAPRGAAIRAAASGKVVFAGRNHGYGNMVMLQHADGRRTLYAHAERLMVRTGQTVSSGQTIAAVGSTGHSTGPHLHFEVREAQGPVNPLTVLANDNVVARR